MQLTDKVWKILLLPRLENKLKQRTWLFSCWKYQWWVDEAGASQSYLSRGNCGSSLTEGVHLTIPTSLIPSWDPDKQKAS